MSYVVAACNLMANAQKHASHDIIEFPCFCVYMYVCIHQSIHHHHFMLQFELHAWLTFLKSLICMYNKSNKGRLYLGCTCLSMGERHRILTFFIGHWYWYTIGHNHESYIHHYISPSMWTPNTSHALTLYLQRLQAQVKGSS